MQGYISLHTSCSRLQYPPPSHDSYIMHVMITCIAFMIEELKKQPLSSTDMAVVLGEGSEHLKLAHYRNKLLHWFLPEAFLLLCLLRLPELNISISILSRYVVICIFLKLKRREGLSHCIKLFQESLFCPKCHQKRYVKLNL